MGCAGVLWCAEMLGTKRFRIAGAVGTLAALALVGFAAFGGPLGPHNVFIAGASFWAWCCALAYRITCLSGTR